MIRIAIVEDQDAAAQTLEGYLQRFREATAEEFQITRYADALAFLNPYLGFDLVFMDIQMPYLDGLSGAARLREIDTHVKLIFVTNMAQYAVRGYEVDALDFVVKPIAYTDFVFKMKRALRAISVSRQKQLAIMQPNGMVRLHSGEVKYVEVRGHNLIYHTADREFQLRGTMKSAQEQLAEWDFLRCNNCYLVNPRHIRWVRDYTVKVGDTELQISHPRKKQFMEELSNWYARGGR